jgi:hypothetical protein
MSEDRLSCSALLSTMPADPSEATELFVADERLAGARPRADATTRLH